MSGISSRNADGSPTDTRLIRRFDKDEHGYGSYPRGERGTGGPKSHPNAIPKGGHKVGDEVRVRGNMGRAAVGGEGNKGTITSSHGSFHTVKYTTGEPGGIGSHHESDLHNLSRGGSEHIGAAAAHSAAADAHIAAAKAFESDHPDAHKLSAEADRLSGKAPMTGTRATWAATNNSSNAVTWGKKDPAKGSFLHRGAAAAHRTAADQMRRRK